MRLRLYKELRLLLPACFLGLILPFLPFPFARHGEATGLSNVFLMVGCALVGAVSFGPELSQRTLAQLLSQPISRRRIWYEKMVVLGLGLILPSTAALWIQWDQQPGPTLALILLVPLCAFCSAPCLTLWTRSAIGGGVFAVVIPVVLGLAAGSLATYLVRNGVLENVLPAAWANDGDAPVIGAVAIVLILYCAVCFCLGFMKLQRFQAVDSMTEEDAFGKSFAAWFGLVINNAVPKRVGATWSLIEKELQLQRIPCALALILCLFEILVLGFVWLASPTDPKVYYWLPLIIYTAVIPILTGALSMAEERGLGVHAWQLTQPVSALRQWGIKICVTCTVSFVLGVFLPAIVFLLGNAFLEFLPQNQEFHVSEIRIWLVLSVCAVQLLFTAIAIYASSVSGNTLGAAVLAAALSGGGSVMLGWAVRLLAYPLRFLAEPRIVAAPFGLSADPEIPVYDSAIGSGALPAALASLILIGLLLMFSFSNYRRLRISWRQLPLQFAAVFVPVLFSLLLIGALLYLSSLDSFF